jgi:glutathione S-transferase
MSDPVLYGLSRSVYTRIARLALEEKGVRYTLEEVEIFGPDGVPHEHLQRQPFGRIPAFAHDGFLLYETDAITRYVDETFVGSRLQPQEPLARARMNQVIGIVDSYAYRPMVWGVFGARIVAPAENIQPDEQEFAQSLPRLVSVVARSKRFSAASATSPATSSRSRTCMRCRSCCISRWRAKVLTRCWFTHACDRGSTTWRRGRACSGPRVSSS